MRVGDDLRRARLGVGVEAPPALAAEQPRAHHLLDDRARRVQPVAALLVHRVEDLVRGVEADEVEQRERAHRVAAAEAHRRVEVLAGRVAALEHRHRVVEVAEEQRVRDEAGLVADDDRLLAEPLGERLDVLEDVVGGDDRADHLDELLHRRRVEEVHADDPLGVADVATAISVTGSDEVFVARMASARDDLVDPAEQLALEVQVLGHGLDDELAAGEVVEVARERHPRRAGRRAPPGSSSRGPARVRWSRRAPALPCSTPVVVDLDGDHVDPVAGEHLHDPRAHRPESDHTHTGEVTRHGRDPCRGAPGVTRGRRRDAPHPGRWVTPRSRTRDAVRRSAPPHQS